MARQRMTWVTEQEFYGNARETGRYGGETDYGTGWQVDAEHSSARLTWIANNGELYLYAVRLDGTGGRYMSLAILHPDNAPAVEACLAGWAQACLRRERVAWILKCVRPYAQAYRSEELAARAWGRDNGVNGNHGGWLYLNGACWMQGWGRLAALLVRQGHIKKVGGAWRVVDNRSIRARQTDRKAS